MRKSHAAHGRGTYGRASLAWDRTTGPPRYAAGAVAGRFLDVVQSLVDEPTGGELVALSPAVAVLALRDSTLAIVASTRRGDVERLREMLTDLVAQTRGNDIKVVVVGGGEAEQQVVAAVQPTVMLGRTVQAFALDDRGAVWVGARTRTDSPVGRVLAEVGAREVPREVDFAELATRVRVPTVEDRERAENIHTFVKTTRSGLPHVTVGILAGLVGAFGLQHLWGGVELIPTMYRMGGNTPIALHGEPWRLVSHAWLHSGVLHLLVNGYVLYSLGGLIERLLGSTRLLVIYALSAIAGGIASATFGDALISVGASGAIWGVLGASIALAWRPAGLIPDAVLPVVRRNAVVNLMINLAMSFLPNIDLMAHIGGGLAGGLLVLSGIVTRGVAAGSPDKSRGWQAAAVVSGGVLVASIVTAIAIGRPWALFERGQTRHEVDGGIAVVVPDAFGPVQVDHDGTQWMVSAGELLRDRGTITWTVENHGFALHDPAELDLAFDEILALAPAELEGAESVEERQVDRGDGVRTITSHYQYPNGIAILVTVQLRATTVVRTEALWWSAHESTRGELERATAAIEVPETLGLPDAPPP